MAAARIICNLNGKKISAMKFKRKNGEYLLWCNYGKHYEYPEHFRMTKSENTGLYRKGDYCLDCAAARALKLSRANGVKPKRYRDHVAIDGILYIRCAKCGGMKSIDLFYDHYQARKRILPTSKKSSYCISCDNERTRKSCHANKNLRGRSVISSSRQSISKFFKKGHTP